MTDKEQRGNQDKHKLKAEKPKPAPSFSGPSAKVATSTKRG